MYIPEQLLSMLVIGKIVKEPPGGWSSLIGIVTAIVGNVLISFALNTQRYAHLRLQKEAEQQESSPRAETPVHHSPSSQSSRSTLKGTQNGNGNAVHAATQDEDYEDADETDALLPMAQKGGGSRTSSHSGFDDLEQRQKSYLKSPYWWIGIGLMAVGEAGNFLAYGFAPASIVSPLGVVALISNCLVAPIMLHEQFRKRDGLGVLIAVGGAVTIVLSAEGSNPKLGPDEIWDMVKRWEFLTYLGISISLIVILMLSSRKYGKKTILIDLGLVGLFGGYTALSTKGVSSLLSYRLWKVVTFPIFYLLIAILVGTAIMQVKYVNRSLQNFDSTQVIPVQFVMFTLSVIIGSALLYRDFESMTKEKVIQFIGGCALTFLGVWLLTSGHKDNGSSDKDANTIDEEQGITLEDEEAEENDTLRPSPPTTPKRSWSAWSSSKANATDSPASFATASSRLPTTPRAPPLSAANSTPAVPTTNLSASLPPAAEPAGLRDTSASAARRRPPAHHASSDPRTPSSAYVTPGPASQGRFLTPDATPSADRAARTLWPRRSISSMVNPKALTSPLSSGLSVIVADSLRRAESASAKLRRYSSARSRKGSTGAVQALSTSTRDRPVVELSSETERGSSVAASSGYSSRRTSMADTDEAGRGHGKAPQR